MPETSIAKILVIDDEAELKNALVDALSAQSFEVRGFTNGAQALSVLRQEAFDVILSDLMMPEMDGITLVEKALQIDPHLVAIIMTGQGTIQTAVDAMKVGAFDYVLKPFRLATLLPTLTRAINTRRLRLENIQLRETVAIHELAQTIAFKLDPQTIISKLADAALQQTEADEVSILLPTSSGEELYVAAVRGENRQRLLGERVPLEESISGWVAREREPLILDGEINDARFRSLCPQPDIRSAISIPMQVAGKLVGTININALDRARPFTLGQMKALTILASTAAAAIESASLYGQVRRAKENYRSIFDNAVEGIFQITPDGRLLNANAALARILGYGSPAEVITDVTDIAKQIYVRSEDRAESDRKEQEHGVLRGFELEAYRKDGEKIWLSLNRHSVRDESGAELYCEGSIEDITERKRAEEALAKSEERYRALVESLPAFIYCVQPDPPYSPLYLNSNLEELGYSTDEWYSEPDLWLNILHPDDREWVIRATETAKTAGTETDYEYRVMAKDGSIRWLHDRGRFLTDADGVRTWQGVILDITARKRAEEVIRESERKFKELFDDAPVAYHEIDNEGRLTRVNLTEQRLLGYTAEEMQGRFAWEFIVEKESRDAIAAKLSGKALLHPFERTFIRKDGTLVPMQVNDRLLYDVNGESCGIRSTLHDISERKRAEEALRESEEKYRTILESMEEGYAEVDLRGTYVFVNDSFCRISGRSRSELLGVNYKELFDREQRQLLFDTYHKVYETGETIRGFEYEVTWKDGTRRVVEESVTLRRDAEGRPIGFTGTRRDCTERKQAENALRESEERYRDLVENSHEIICTHDLDGKILSVNRATLHLLGYEPSDFINKKNIQDVLAPEVRDQFGDYMKDILEKRETTNLMLVQTRSGERRILEYYNSLRTEGVAEPVVRAIARDITEKRRAEAALRESEERYRDMVENAHDIIYSHDLEGNYTSSNRASQEITGYTPEESLKLNFTQTISPEFQPKAIEMMKRKLAGEKITVYELEIIAKDGHLIPVEVNTRLVIQNGVPVGVTGIARDITERKKAEAEVNKLAVAVEQTADSIVITGTDGTIEYVNPAFERVTGYSKEEVLGQNPRFLKSGKVDPSVYRELWNTITSGGVWSGQLINKKKDGTLFNERVTISAVRDPTGKTTHYLAVKQDTTHELQLEEQLRQSQKMEAIGQLAGGVAHDFNNLLTAINGYASLAVQRLDEHHTIRPYLEEVKKAGERAANLTRQLLAFGRKQILQPIPLDLNGIVSDMNKMLRRLIGEDIDLTAKLASDLKRIKADPGQIEQVLVNLVVNARDAMPQGGSLTIETANLELDREYAKSHVGIQPGKYVMLAVSDTGSGMNEETRARIFEPFFTTKEKGKGTGLGLSTVYGIVQQSGGSIWVYSEINRGTSFKVYLPQLTAPAKATEQKSTAENVPRGSETVLLVEDEEVVRGLATHILEDAGYTVIKARGGEEAIHLCRERAEEIDLLLTDVVMPETSGKEVAEQVTAIMPHLKVLFMSGYTDEAIVHHGVLDANVEFIQKPFTPLGLSRKVREVLDSNGHEYRA